MALIVTAEPGRVVVELTGASALAAVRRRVEIPTASITSVSVRARRSSYAGGSTWLRMPGSFLPGVLRYGSYGIGAEREFWAVKRQPEVVVIETEGRPYRRVVLGVDDPHATAGVIRAAKG